MYGLRLKKCPLQKVQNQLRTMNWMNHLFKIKIVLQETAVSSAVYENPNLKRDRN